MRRLYLLVSLAGLTVALPTAEAQRFGSGSRSGSASRRVVPTAKPIDPAVGGISVVSLRKSGTPEMGRRELRSDYDRQVFWFASPEQKQAFDAEPAAYFPVLGGDCVVRRKEDGDRLPGKPQLSLTHDGRLYLFYSQQDMERFKAAPARYADVDLAVQGYCPVTLIDSQKLEAGKPELTAIHDGYRFRFSGEEQRKLFESNPAKYTPVLNGDCIVTFQETGKRAPGGLAHAAYYEGRLYEFPDDAHRQKFYDDAEKYSRLDLANDGDCVVSRELTGAVVPGSADYVSIYHGRRYLFPSAQQKSVFDAHPNRFAGDR